MTTGDVTTVSAKVLFIVTPSAQADAADRLVKSIEEELNHRGVRVNFDLQQARATKPEDLTRALLSHFQNDRGVVHLCAGNEGDRLVFVSDVPPKTVGADAVAQAVGLLGDLVDWVVLSGCYTDGIADPFTAVAPVIGTTNQIVEEMSNAFFRGFYRGLALAPSGKAFEFGTVEVGLAGFDNAHIEAHCRHAPGPPSHGPDMIPVAGPTPTGGGRAIHNIRPRNPFFTGRSALLDQVAKHLESGNAAVTQTFEGMGGVGKTELAIEFAYRHLDRFQVVWWVGCEELDTIPGAFDALAVRLAIPGENPGERLAALDDWFDSNTEWLVIADNVSSWENTAALLPRGGSVIVTTRERGVHVNGVEVDVFRPEEANEFVRRRLRQPEVDPEPIATALGRLPLALEQACSYILTTGCTVEQYAGLYASRSGLLLNQGRTGGHEHTVAATFSLSLEEAKRIAIDDPHAIDPEDLATLFAFLAADNIPLTLLRALDESFE